MRRRSRDRYLLRLAADPMFRGVPRHLMVVVGRIVDPLYVAAGSIAECMPPRETIIVSSGAALVCDRGGPLAVVAGGGIIGQTYDGPVDVHAITAVCGYVIGQRELPTLLAMAPRLADAAAATAAKEVLACGSSLLALPDGSARHSSPN
jgi:hypothetical protein